MSFLTPLAFLLLALLPVIVAMYLLKLRRTERQVSSVYLWRRMVRDVEANAPWQRLRRNLLLLLQLLFLAALILALSGPFTWREGAGGQAAVLVIDASASMAAVDVAPSRIEAAKSQARQLVDGMPESARVTVIEAGREAQVLLASSSDRRQAHQAIDSIHAGTGGSDMGVALELASAIVARQPEAEVIVLSDGRVSLPERMSLKGALRYLPIGLEDNNQAVSLLTLEPAPGGASLTAFAQVTNYAGAAAKRRLALYADGQLAGAYDLEIQPGGQQAVVAEGLPIDAAQTEARLDGEDDLPLDDVAWAVAPQGEPARVALVSSGNLFLHTALSLLPGIEVTSVDPVTNTGSITGTASLTIYDGSVPVSDTLPAGNLLFIGPPRSTQYFTVTGVVENPVPRPADAANPLLSHVSLAGVSVLDASRIPLPDWATPVIAADADGETLPLLFTGEVDGRRVAVLAFDLHHSDLPLQLAFPLLWANLIGWLAPGSAGALPAQVAPGEAVALPASPGAAQATVTRPDGSQESLSPGPDGRLVFTGADALGVYQVNWGARSEGPPAAIADGATFAVNLFSPQESSILPAQSLPVAAGQGEGQDATLRARREWWRPVALLALALLVAEWLVYQRAALSRLRDQARALFNQKKSFKHE